MHPEHPGPNFPRAMGPLLGALALATPALAQQAPVAPDPIPQKSEIPPADERHVTAKFDLNVEDDLPADLDGAGDVSLWRAGGWLGVRVPVEQYHVLDLEVSSEYSFYNFENATTLAPATGDPLGAALDTRVGARLFLRTAERWGVYAGGDIGSAGEPGAKFGDTISGGVVAGFVYWISKDFSLGAGINARTHLEDDFTLYPAINIDWKINDSLTLGTSQRIIDRGGGITLSYAASETVTLSLSGAYETREYRLDQDGAAPDGVLSDLRFPIALGVAWKATPNFMLSARAGAHLWQDYELRDQDGNEISSDETDTQFFFGLGAQFTF